MKHIYTLGFNEGYLISQHKPELAGAIANVVSNAPRIVGIKDGHRQFVLEQLRELQPNWMHRQDYGLPPPELENDRDKGIER